MFSSISNAIATLLNIAASVLWGVVEGIAAGNAGAILLVVLAVAALFLLFRFGAARLRPTKDGRR
jgi:hypothetical protein